MIEVDPSSPHSSPPDNSSTQPPPRSPRFKVRAVQDDTIPQESHNTLSTPDKLELQPVGRITTVVEHRLIASTPLSPPPRQLNYDPSPDPTPPVQKKVMMSRSLDSVNAEALGMPTSPAQPLGSKPGGRLSRFQVKAVTTSTAGTLTPLAEHLARAVTLDEDGTASAATLGSRRQLTASPPLVHIVEASPRQSITSLKASPTALGYFAGSIGSTEP